MIALARTFAALVLAAFALPVGPATGEEPLPRLAEVGPWPAVSRLVAYRGRLWFANSVKGRNHNSADLYSYDPARGELRYEQHLFSQDAGKPLVFEGRLYWPYEDPRVSLGWGEILVTDGADWQGLTLPTAAIYHVHALAESGGRLLAATSAWRAGLQVSDDGGVSWRQIYDHPTPEGRVSRITRLLRLGDRLLAYLVMRGGRRLLVVESDRVADLPGWPEDAALRGWARLNGWVYLLVATDAGVAVWRSDGATIEAMTPPRPDWQLRGLAADAGGLWAVGLDGDAGRLWRSPDGRRWQVLHPIVDGRPHEVLVYAGSVFVGGAGADGRGRALGRRHRRGDVSGPRRSRR